MIYYRWHPLFGRSARRIQGERRASGEFVHVELMAGIVTIVPAWKLDPVFCTGLKVGLPQVSLGALLALHELLMALELRLSSADGTAVTEEADHGIADTARTKDGATPSQQGPLATAPHQLDLVLDDVRLRGMTQGERCRALRTLAYLLLEATGMAMQEAGDDHE